ncbi:MAG: YtxH domain-containing protein [Fimbriimonadia bacterium]|jgi:gas vesicle protein
MSDESGGEDRNVLIYMLAGIGLGALIGAAAGLMFAPKPGTETREDVAKQLAEMKRKLSEWYAEQKAKRGKGKEEAELEAEAG